MHWGETEKSPRRGHDRRSFQTDVLEAETALGVAGFPVSILIRRFPGRVSEHESRPQRPNPPVSGLHFQPSENQALLTPSGRRRWRGHPLPPPGARALPPQHFTPFKRLCPNRQRCVSNKALPENGSETLCNECRSRFQRGQHPARRPVLSDTPHTRLPCAEPSQPSTQTHARRRRTPAHLLTRIRHILRRSGSRKSPRFGRKSSPCKVRGGLCPSWTPDPTCAGSSGLSLLGPRGPGGFPGCHRLCSRWGRQSVQLAGRVKGAGRRDPRCVATAPGVSPRDAHCPGLQSPLPYLSAPRQCVVGTATSPMSCGISSPCADRASISRARHKSCEWESLAEPEGRSRYPRSTQGLPGEGVRAPLSLLHPAPFPSPCPPRPVPLGLSEGGARSPPFPPSPSLTCRGRSRLQMHRCGSSSES